MLKKTEFFVSQLFQYHEIQKAIDEIKKNVTHSLMIIRVISFQ